MSSPHSFTKEQLKKYEEEIRNLETQATLQPWLVYIQDKEKTLAGADKKYLLQKVLERCCKRFQSEEKYKTDMTYVQIWLKYAEKSSDPSIVFKFMASNSIGTTMTGFYVVWAYYYEKKQNYKQALQIIESGKKRIASPNDLSPYFDKYRSMLVPKPNLSPPEEDSDGLALVSPRVTGERDRPFVPSFMRGQQQDALRKADSAPALKKNANASVPSTPKTPSQPAFTVFIDSEFANSVDRPRSQQKVLPVRRTGTKVGKDENAVDPGAMQGSQSSNAQMILDRLTASQQASRSSDENESRSGLVALPTRRTPVDAENLKPAVTVTHDKENLIPPRREIRRGPLVDITELEREAREAREARELAAKEAVKPATAGFAVYEDVRVTTTATSLAPNASKLVLSKSAPNLSTPQTAVSMSAIGNAMGKPQAKPQASDKDVNLQEYDRSQDTVFCVNPTDLLALFNNAKDMTATQDMTGLMDSFGSFSSSNNNSGNVAVPLPAPFVVYEDPCLVKSQQANKKCPIGLKKEVASANENVTNSSHAEGDSSFFELDGSAFADLDDEYLNALDSDDGGDDLS